MKFEKPAPQTLDSYQETAEIINEFWYEVFRRIPAHKLPWAQNGVGTCSGTPGIDFDDLMGGQLNSEPIHQLQAAHIVEHQDPDRCIYHNAHTGCTVGSLKSIKCLTHIDYQTLTFLNSVLDSEEIKNISTVNRLRQLIQAQPASETPSKIAACIKTEVLAATEKVRAKPIVNNL